MAHEHTPSSAKVINLARSAKVYNALLRSLRLARGGVASLTATLLVAPVGIASILVVPINDKPTPMWALVALLGASWAFYGGVLYVFFYFYRALAAGSRPVIKTMSACLVLLLFSGVWGIVSVDPAMTAHGPVAGGGLESFLIRSFIMLHELVPMVMISCIAYGLLVVAIKGSSTTPLLCINRNYDRHFWLGARALLKEFWHVMGFPAPPRAGSKWASVAAVGALVLEGFSFSIYLGANDRLDKSLDNMAQQNWPQKLVLLSVVLVVVLQPVSVLMFFALSRRLRAYARRRALLSAEQARLIDTRRPVLFLRAFRDDQVSLSAARPSWLLNFIDPGSVSGSLEELVVQEFAHLGPVVTIGRPGEALPPLGAARRYCGGEDWHEIVSMLMDEASLVIVGVGFSQGLEWEIARLTSRGLLSRTVFVFPPHLATDRQGREQLFRMVGLSSGMQTDGFGQAILALCYSSAMHALLITSAHVTEIEYQLAVRTWMVREHLVDSSTIIS
jgi:hypothetical protein